MIREWYSDVLSVTGQKTVTRSQRNKPEKSESAASAALQLYKLEYISKPVIY
jgi:hypothetical protein